MEKTVEEMKEHENVLSDEAIEKALQKNSKEAEELIQDEDKFENFVKRLEEKLELVPVIGKYLVDIANVISLVRSYIKKEYTEVPLGTIIWGVSTLIYIFSPIDLIPDVIPVIGYGDDIAALLWLLNMIHSDIEDYKQWRGEVVKEEEE